MSGDCSGMIVVEAGPPSLEIFSASNCPAAFRQVRMSSTPGSARASASSIEATAPSATALVWK